MWGGDEGEGAPLGDGLEVAGGTDGQSGSGMYSIGADGESAGIKVERLLAKLRDQGMGEPGCGRISRLILRGPWHLVKAVRRLMIQSRIAQIHS